MNFLADAFGEMTAWVRQQNPHRVTQPVSGGVFVLAGFVFMAVSFSQVGIDTGSAQATVAASHTSPSVRVDTDMDRGLVTAELTPQLRLPAIAAEPLELSPFDPGVAELSFASGSTRVDARAAKASLSSLVVAMTESPCRRLLVEGHSNRIGDEFDNLILSWRRAEATQRWLTRSGVPKKRIIVRSYGDFRPKLTDDPRADIQRRVEVRLLDCADSEAS